MNCDICGRPHNAQRLPFLCAVDARNQLYEPRIAQVQALLQNEQLENQINAALDHRSPAANSVAATNKIRLDDWKAEQQKAVDRTNGIIAQADRLRADMEAARKDIAARKGAIARRRSDLSSASSGLEARRTRQREELERSIGMTKFKWNRSADSMAATRGFLCMEAARLYGLKRVKKGSAMHYEIGGIEIVEPHAMNSTSPEVISTCLAHITHILMLATHYLAIRLPAEVTLPHRDYPRSTIFSLASSYSHGEISFPSSAMLAQPPTSGRERGDQVPQPRPRPLFLEKPLPALAKEDPLAHKMFIEGVSLLAYDIAWACCSQGVPIGDKSSFEDVTNMGRNLYNLLIGNQLHSNPAGRIFPAANAKDGELGDMNKATTLMGRYSHGTAHSFLGDDFSRSFKLPNPKSLTDRLKSKLSSEGTAADWEVLEDEAWTVDDHLEDGVMLKGSHKHEPKQRPFGVESIATVRTTMEDTIASDGFLSRRGGEPPLDRAKNSGTSGWTKLKSR